MDGGLVSGPVSRPAPAPARGSAPRLPAGQSPAAATTAPADGIYTPGTRLFRRVPGVEWAAYP